VRERLWHFLEPEGRPPHSPQTQAIALKALREVHESVEINLAELERLGVLPKERRPG